MWLSQAQGGAGGEQRSGKTGGDGDWEREGLGVLGDAQEGARRC